MSIWKKYLKSQQYLDEQGVIRNANWYWDMYLGEQWRGVKTSTKLPVMNITKQVVDYKTAAIAQNQMTAVFSDSKDRYQYEDLYKTLNRKWKAFWKDNKMDAKMYRMVLEAGVQGDAYLYFGERDRSMLVPDTAVLLADEQQSDIQLQKYIMLRYRPFVEDVKKEARMNGIPETDIAAITSDSEPDYLVGNKEDIDYSSMEGKTTAVIYFEKIDGVVHIAKATRSCVFRPLAPLSMTDGESTLYASQLYPVVKFTCEHVPNSARGRGWVVDMIPNQIELNKNYAKASAAIANTAYPRIAYDSNAITNPEALHEVGSPIAVNGNAQSIDTMIKYLSGVPMSGDVMNYIEDMFTKSKMLAGASDAITGISDPTRVSGSAISEIREQSTLTLKGNVVELKQCYEDIANVVLDIWKTYEVDGFSMTRMPNEDEMAQIENPDMPMPDLEDRITGQELRDLDADIDIDVTLRTEATKDATQGILDSLRDGQFITFEEWVEASDEQGTVPKERLMKIIANRPPEQQVAPEQQMPPEQIQ